MLIVSLKFWSPVVVENLLKNYCRLFLSLYTLFQNGVVLHTDHDFEFAILAYSFSHNTLCFQIWHLKNLEMLLHVRRLSSSHLSEWNQRLLPCLKETMSCLRAYEWLACNRATTLANHRGIPMAQDHFRNSFRLFQCRYAKFRKAYQSKSRILHGSFRVTLTNYFNRHGCALKRQKNVRQFHPRKNTSSYFRN